MKHKLSRQEIKRDEVLEGLAGIWAYLQHHTKSMMFGILGILVAVGAVLAYGAVRKGKEQRANIELAAALESYRAEDRDDEATRQALEVVVDGYGGTDAGSVANVYLGSMAAERGDVDEARRRWEAFLQAEPEHMLAASVQMDLISLDRSEGDDEQLVERLRGFLPPGKSALPEDAVLFELGVTLEDLGRPGEALSTYDDLIERFPSSVYISDARTRKNILEASEAT